MAGLRVVRSGRPLDQSMRELTNQFRLGATVAVAQGAQDLQRVLRAQASAAGLGRGVANAWRTRLYPQGRPSVNAAGFIYSKAPKIIDAFERGASIESADGFYLAIPLPAAGRRPGGGKWRSPDEYERVTGNRLRFVYRKPPAKSLLVVDNAPLTRGGRVQARQGFRRVSGLAFTRRGRQATVPVFILIRRAKLPKLLNTNQAADQAQLRLAQRIVQVLGRG